MAYRQLATTAAQTAANVAGGVVGSLILANQVETPKEAAEAVGVVFDELFERLNAVVDADNETLIANEEAPKPTPAGRGATSSRAGGAKGGGSRGRKTGSSNGKVTLAAARKMELKGGAFEGVTLEGLLDIDADEAEADYGYGDGERGGLEYLEWLASDRNNNDYSRPRAELVLAAAEEGNL